jgi:hypothetical protein
MKSKNAKGYIIILACLMQISGIDSFAIPKPKKFIKKKYDYILKIDSLISVNSDDSVCLKDYLDKLNEDISNFKLNKRDLLLVRLYINRVRLIANFPSIVKFDSVPFNKSVLISKQIDLYRDYALVSAQLQARFESKYIKLKEDGEINLAASCAAL